MTGFEYPKSQNFVTPPPAKKWYLSPPLLVFLLIAWGSMSGARQARAGAPPEFIAASAATYIMVAVAIGVYWLMSRRRRPNNEPGFAPANAAHGGWQQRPQYDNPFAGAPLVPPAAPLPGYDAPVTVTMIEGDRSWSEPKPLPQVQPAWHPQTQPQQSSGGYGWIVAILATGGIILLMCSALIAGGVFLVSRAIATQSRTARSADLREVPTAGRTTLSPVGGDPFRKPSPSEERMAEFKRESDEELREWEERIQKRQDEMRERADRNREEIIRRVRGY